LYDAGYVTRENVSRYEIVVALAKIESDLVALVKGVCGELFVIFDFFKLDDSIVEQIVNDFVNGHVT
jgi:hypothetical protein